MINSIAKVENAMGLYSVDLSILEFINVSYEPPTLVFITSNNVVVIDYSADEEGKLKSDFEDLVTKWKQVREKLDEATIVV